MGQTIAVICFLVVVGRLVMWRRCRRSDSAWGCRQMVVMSTQDRSRRTALNLTTLRPKLATVRLMNALVGAARRAVAICTIILRMRSAAYPEWRPPALFGPARACKLAVDHAIEACKQALDLAPTAASSSKSKTSKVRSSPNTHRPHQDHRGREREFEVVKNEMAEVVMRLASALRGDHGGEGAECRQSSPWARGRSAGPVPEPRGPRPTPGIGKQHAQQTSRAPYLDGRPHGHTSESSFRRPGRSRWTSRSTAGPANPADRRTACSKQPALHTNTG